jgi:hypothetical protein
MVEIIMRDLTRLGARVPLAARVATHKHTHLFVLSEIAEVANQRNTSVHDTLKKCIANYTSSPINRPDNPSECVIATIAPEIKDSIAATLHTA